MSIVLKLKLEDFREDRMSMLFTLFNNSNHSVDILKLVDVLNWELIGDQGELVGVSSTIPLRSHRNVTELDGHNGVEIDKPVVFPEVVDLGIARRLLIKACLHISGADRKITRMKYRGDFLISELLEGSEFILEEL